MCSQLLTHHKSPAPGETNETSPLLQQTVALPRQSSQLASTELEGYFLMAGSCFGFAGMSLLVHIAEDRFNFPTSSALFIRGIVQTLLSILYILRYLPFPETFSSLSQKQLRLLALRGLAGSLSIAVYFATLRKLPVGDAVTLFFCAPVVTMILSSIILGERITLIDSIAAVTSFTGIVLVARPEFGLSGAVSPRDRILGGLYGLIGALLSSVAYVVIRSLGTSIHFMVSVFSLGFVTIIVSTSLGGSLGPVGFWMMKEAALALVLASCFAFGAQCCVNRGLQLCRIGPGVLLRNLDVPLAYILGMLFLNESPSLLRLFGSMLVLLAAVMIGLRQIVQSRSPTSQSS